jgi:hypothetical protein
MSSRTAKFVSAIFATLLAGASFVSASHGAPAEAETCLAGPKGAAPAGGHWYYRVDRATKRSCWYIGEAKAKTSGKIARAAPEASPPPTDSASAPKKADTGTPPSIADARAEWPLPSSRGGPEGSVYTAPRPLATVSGAIRPETDAGAKPGDAGAQGSVIGSRWPELAGVASTSANPGPSVDNSAATPPVDATATPPTAKLAPPAAVAALPVAAADAPPTERPVGSVQMLLIAILSALALAGVLASPIFRLGSGRRNNGRVDRRVNWDPVRTDRTSLSDEARADRSTGKFGLLPQGSLPRELRTADDADDRIAQLLSRPPRRAVT